MREWLIELGKVIFGLGIATTKNWYVVDPLGHNQINEIAFYKLLKKYQPKKWKQLSKKVR